MIRLQDFLKTDLDPDPDSYLDLTKKLRILFSLRNFKNLEMRFFHET